MTNRSTKSIKVMANRSTKSCMLPFCTGKRSLLLSLFFDVKEDNHMKRMERVKEGIMPLIIPEKFNCDALEDDITEFLTSTKRNNSYIAATDTDEFNMIFS